MVWCVGSLGCDLVIEVCWMSHSQIRVNIGELLISQGSFFRHPVYFLTMSIRELLYTDMASPTPVKQWHGKLKDDMASPTTT